MNKQDYTPMMQQYLTIKEAYEDSIVFFRLGDFYEMFFDDALLASKELEIQLTGRDAGAKERVPMCGVPHHSAESYIETLIHKGYKVAICEQVEDVNASKGIVKRDVVRVITPGTYTEDSDALLYIASLSISGSTLCLSYMNILSGEFFVVDLPYSAEAVMNELKYLDIKELVVNKGFDTTSYHDFLKREGILLNIQTSSQIDGYEHLLKDLTRANQKESARLLLSYVSHTQKRVLLHIKAAQVIKQTGSLRMDSYTVSNLELFETTRNKTYVGTLFWYLNKTETALGARTLKKALLRPLVNKDIIALRHDAVESLLNDYLLTLELKEHLKRMYDLERIITKLSYGTVNARDLLQLKRSLSAIPLIKSALKSSAGLLNHIHATLDPLIPLYDELEQALLDEAPNTITEGRLFKLGYDDALDEVINKRDHHEDILTTLEVSEREKTGIKKLKIGYNKVFGYYIEVPKSQDHLIKEDLNYIRKQTLTNSERYITPELKDLEVSILSSFEASKKMEYDLFITLKEKIKGHIPVLQTNADMIGLLDMLLSFAMTAEKHHLTKPIISDAVNIKDAWHPVIASVMTKTPFIKNDFALNEDVNVLLITGPNMSGKSTYMRQLALIAVMNQIGSFVPARQAEIKLFDQLFTRMGASDDLFGGQSTFMVEMLNARDALKHATQESLILLDEIGRGTATFDGMALAQAIVEYIHNHIHAITLFSTHYHELTVLDQDLKHLKNVHIETIDDKGNITFLHKVKDGPASQSYGIHVAKLAELPDQVIKRASVLLRHLESSNINHTNPSMDLFNYSAFMDNAEPHEILTLLEDLNIEKLTPLEALNILYELKKKL
jgi:DNA mismatch repair protein MutS